MSAAEGPAAVRTVGPNQGALYAAQQIRERHRPTPEAHPRCVECDYEVEPAGCPTWQLVHDVLAAIAEQETP